jgi:thiamine-phosphate pyrophosphorylase
MYDANLRAIDANLNRAREALRVLEDAVRFGGDDAAASARLKDLRHRLGGLREAFGGAALLAARDVEHDVGREITHDAERTRDSMDSVVGAAMGRLTESLRSIAEFAKLAGNAECAAAAEQLRYAAYAMEPLLRLRLPARARLKGAGLYVIVTEALCGGRPWLSVAEAALRGGAGVLQLREKSLSDAELLRRGRALRELTRRFSAMLAINDRPDIARLCDADILHLGQDDLPAGDARRIVGAGMLIGVSTHTAAQFAAAGSEAVDYIAVGPMFPTATKPQEHIAGPETLRRLRGGTDLPIVAIGGIHAGNAGEVRAAGADVLCVCSAVIAADDPEAAARGLLGS